MKFSPREWILAWATAAVALGGVTYALAAARMGDWRELRRARTQLEQRQAAVGRLLRQKDNIDQRLEALRGQLARFPSGQDVTADLLLSLERMAREQGLNLSRREPEKERSVGDLYEVAINCTWEADLEALVRFLYALQQQRVILNIRQLTVTPVPGRPGTLRGSFALDCAFSRDEAAPPAEAQKPSAPKR